MIKIIINREIKIIVYPVIFGVPISNLISWWRVLSILEIKIFFKVGVTQNDEGIIIKNVATLSQLLKIGSDEDGSKIENKLVIIFIKFHFLDLW